MIIVDTGSIPKTHPLRMQSKGYKSTMWVLSSSVDDACDCDFLLEFGFPVSDEGVFGQWNSAVGTPSRRPQRTGSRSQASRTHAAVRGVV